MNIAKAEKFVAELNKKIEAKNKEIIKYNSITRESIIRCYW